MDRLKIILVTMTFSFLLSCAEDPSVSMVKSGVLDSCPDKNMDEMVNGFLGSPKWTSGISEDGQKFVNIEGRLTYAEKEVDGLIQFLVNDDNNSFEFSAFEINEVPQSILIANALLEKMCE